MKTVVLYKSKTGFVKKYAEWISKELSADLFEVSDVSIDMIKEYDVVIYGGGLYAVGINGIRFITQNMDKLKDKKIVVFASGATPLRKETLNEVKDKNFTSEQQKYIKFFYLRGGFDYSKLPVFSKIAMTLLKWKLKIRKKLVFDEMGMLMAFYSPKDFTAKKNINELISYIKNA